MNKKSIKVYGAIALVAVAGLAVVAFQKVRAFVAQGIQDSKSLRVSDTNCDKTQQSSKAHFSGCSSII